MHPQNTQDQAPAEAVERAALVRDVTFRLVESGLPWNEASSLAAALAAALPPTTTEWGVLQPRIPGLHRGPWTKSEAEEWIAECEADGMRPGAFVLASREVTGWREVTP